MSNLGASHGRTPGDMHRKSSENRSRYSILDWNVKSIYFTRLKYETRRRWNILVCTTVPYCWKHDLVTYFAIGILPDWVLLAYMCPSGCLKTYDFLLLSLINELMRNESSFTKDSLYVREAGWSCSPSCRKRLS